MGFKCFNVVYSVVCEATKRFYPLWRLNEENLACLESYCEIIDHIGSNSFASGYEVQVDDIKMTITIIMECSSVQILKRDRVFHDLVDRSIETSFSTAPNGNLNVKFVFPSLWERVR